MGVDEKLERWKEYIENLFNDIRQDSPPDISKTTVAPEITQEDVKQAVKLKKNRRADNVHAETFKLAATEDEISLDLITEEFNRMYSMSHFGGATRSISVII
ncbi:hypothetical protein HHI36_019112 [Cryptolaemus montrouzieri]|uniref:Non-structural maintenance of chromosomes element 4 n=1 Tax=Cryptolaemus montrouzieri TaxID=559131 RepID=A0ABD2P1Z3_9CUCU